jgi:hypothetical protein
MLNKLKFSARTISLFALIILLCSLFLSFACSPAQSTPPPQQNTQPSTPVKTPDNTATPPEQQQETGGWKPDGVISTGEYDRLASYDDGKYEIAWKADNEYIYIFMRAQTEGFVAVGIQPDIAMQQADIIFGVVQNGKASVLDEYSPQAFGPHKPDTDFQGGVNNITEYGGIESGGYTVIEFKRQLDTGDLYDHPVNKGINKIIWAYGASDDPNVKHVSRGYGQIEI